MRHFATWAATQGEQHSSSSSSGAGSGGDGGGGGGSGGGGRPPPPSGGDEGGNESQPPQLPFTSMQLSQAVLVLCGATGALLVAVLWLLRAAGSAHAALAVVEASLEGMADGASTRDSVAAIKRLLRELFAEQLGVKQRLAAAEKATTLQLEAADEYELQLLSSDGGSSSWSRAPVRASGQVVAAGALPWSQEADGGAALSKLCALGAGGATGMRLQLHSVLAGGKRRLTVELSQGAAGSGSSSSSSSTAALQLQRLLYRVQANSWLQLMIAPLGGSLDALARSVTPIRGDFGCTPAMRHGHGLTALQQGGSGKALSISSRQLSAAAGFFVGGSSKAGVGQLQWRSPDGKSLSLVAAHCRPRAGGLQQQQQQEGSSSSGGSSSLLHGADEGLGQNGLSPALRRLRFLGVQSPQQQLSRGNSQPPMSGAVLGGAGVLPIGDTLTATAWAEQPPCGPAGWGVGLYVQPDSDGVELAVGVGKPSRGRHHAAAPQPFYCEVSAKVPAGDGLSISPCAIFTHTAGASSLAYVMQSSWRF